MSEFPSVALPVKSCCLAEVWTEGCVARWRCGVALTPPHRFFPFLPPYFCFLSPLHPTAFLLHLPTSPLSPFPASRFTPHHTTSSSIPSDSPSLSLLPASSSLHLSPFAPLPLSTSFRICPTLTLPSTSFTLPLPRLLQSLPFQKQRHLGAPLGLSFPSGARGPGTQGKQLITRCTCWAEGREGRLLGGKGERPLETKIRGRRGEDRDGLGL